MMTRVIQVLFLVIGIGLFGIAHAAGASIVQRESADGAVELSNLGSDDDAATVLVVSSPSDQGSVAASDAGPTDGSSATVSAVAAPAKPSTTAAAGSADAEVTDLVAQRSASYRDRMLDPTLAASGKPVNAAVQRRYLMVKKSDFVSGN
jgi:hypothetical protein